jgi:hypothetical protein
MATGAGDGLEAAGRGHLRASHADREWVIGTLKAAFVQGRLTKDELDARAGRAYAARTYADLSALTADLPAGLTAAVPPGRAAGAPARRPRSNAARAGMCVVIVVTVSAVLSFPSGGAAFLLFTPFFFMALAVFVAETLVSRLDQRSRRRRPPPGPAPGLGGQSSRRLPSAGPGRQLPPAEPGHRHAAEAARMRIPRRSSAGPRSPRRRRPGQAAGSMTTFRPWRLAALPNAAPALASPNLSVTSGARLKLPAATRPIARP